MAYNMKDSSLKIPQLKKIYNEEMKSIDFKSADLDCIFDRCCARKELFPNGRKKVVVDEKTYIHDWIVNYRDAINGLPSERIAKKKRACSDPAVITLVKSKKSMKQIDRLVKYHELLMAAENCLGELLEEYIYTEAKSKGADLAWCVGKCVKGVDFCTKNGDEIQIKNKYNTENSSSKKARNELGIDVWFRIKGTDKAGNPIFNWDELNEILGGMCPTVSFDFSEDDFQSFLNACATKNKHLFI